MTTHRKEFLEANTPKEEKNMFNMKTMPWMILVNNEAEFDAVDEWLVGQGYPSIGCKYPKYCKYLTNTTSGGSVADGIMHGGNAASTFRHEIKLNFKTVVDSVEWPVVESERDKKIRELEESAKKIQEQINELKNTKE